MQLISVGVTLIRTMGQNAAMLDLIKHTYYYSCQDNNKNSTNPSRLFFFFLLLLFLEDTYMKKPYDMP